MDTFCIFDKGQLKTACQHAGKGYTEALTLPQQGYPAMMMLLSLTAMTAPITPSDRVSILCGVYIAFQSVQRLPSLVDF